MNNIARYLHRGDAIELIDYNFVYVHAGIGLNRVEAHFIKSGARYVTDSFIINAIMSNRTAREKLAPMKYVDKKNLCEVILRITDDLSCAVISGVPYYCSNGEDINSLMISFTRKVLSDHLCGRMNARSIKRWELACDAHADKYDTFVKVVDVNHLDEYLVYSNDGQKFHTDRFAFNKECSDYAIRIYNSLQS